MSNSRLALVGAAGMNPRKRGLSAEMMLGAITDEYTPRTSSGTRPRSRRTPLSALYRSAAGCVPLSSGTGSIRSRFSAYARTLRTICSVV